ncbi:PQQ-dependent sugar dehydrogenase [Roseisolibacter agri]|uniref:PQQ-dependent sugar dehydrogenase n=1 Tax=Roseisolibacter agri TaxID=2014610 RepID=UPI0024E160C3|nr:PQQ-dependent sugar dehydrogenase [Roseisolibacter agri]
MPHRPPFARPRPSRRRLAVGIAAAVLGTAAFMWRRTPPRVQVLDTQEHRVRVTTVVDGLRSPWGLTFLPGGDLLITEKRGRLRLVRAGVLQPEPVAELEVASSGQGGLLDVELHPGFARNRLVYLTYSKPGPRGSTTALARGRWDGSRLVDVQDVFVAEAWGRGGQHFGSRIVFDRAGMVYFGVGERNEKYPAQDLASDKGKILRLHDDGRIPRDNPFVGRTDARPEIFSYGHRNPQGMTLHPVTGELWETEHGARGGDEVNHVRAGRNYGWPRITHGVDYSGARISPDSALPGMEQPVLHWTPSIAPSGLAIYAGDRFPRWRGHLFAGALAGQQLRRVVVEGDRAVHQETLLEGRSRIRAVKNGPDGNLYLLTDASEGSLLRVEPAP